MNFPTPKLNDIFQSTEGIFSVWGDFGVGKTTFALQTAFNAAKLGKVIYIYSKPNFPSEKVGNIIQDKSTVILENIIFIQSTKFYDLNNIINNLEFLILNSLKENDYSIILIIIDSITALYRLELNREKKAKNINLNYQLNQILANLCYINEMYNIEVLIVNEMSRRSYNEQTEEIQSGGKVMDYWVINSINIKRTNKLNVRKFVLTKHPMNKKIELFSLLSENGFE